VNRIISMPQKLHSFGPGQDRLVGRHDTLRPFRPGPGQSETATFFCLAYCSYFSAPGRARRKGRGGDLPALRNFNASKVALICCQIPFQINGQEGGSASLYIPRILHFISIGPDRHWTALRNYSAPEVALYSGPAQPCQSLVMQSHAFWRSPRNCTF
jgi:hypothetical protein